MSRSAFIIISASLVILMPFLGFPRSWEPALFVILGSSIVLTELYRLLLDAYTRHSFARDREVLTDVYAERGVSSQSSDPHYASEASESVYKPKDERVE